MTRVPAMLLLLAGCGGGGEGDTPRADAGPHVDAGPEPSSRGEFYVIEGRDRGAEATSERRYGSVSGTVRDGALPVWQHEAMNDGTCRLLLFTPALCDPYCESGVCVATNHCEPFPSYLSVGRVDVDGLATGPLSMNPQTLNYYFPSGVSPEELFADDATVHLHAAGAGDIPAFDVETRAVAPLAASVENFVVTLEDGVDFVLSWTPAGDPDARVRITLNANNSGHGLPYNGIISCEAYDDAGQVRIPGAMIGAFPETEDWSACAGSDCPRSWMRRFRRAYANVPGGAIALEVASEIQFGVVHRHE